MRVTVFSAVFGLSLAGCAGGADRRVDVDMESDGIAEQPMAGAGPVAGMNGAISPSLPSAGAAGNVEPEPAPEPDPEPDASTGPDADATPSQPDAGTPDAAMPDTGAPPMTPPPPLLPPPSTPADRVPSPDNPAECPAVAPENPFGPCAGLPIYITCSYGTYNCICDWIHWICAG